MGLEILSEPVKNFAERDLASGGVDGDIAALVNELTRQAVEDTTLGGERVRAGTSIVMPIYAIHRHAKRWSEPDAFEPERFAPGREEAIPRFQYLPFGAGPRICIGMGFAMLEATAILATLLQRARFMPTAHEPAPVARVTLVPRGGMPLGVRLRP